MYYCMYYYYMYYYYMYYYYMNYYMNYYMYYWLVVGKAPAAAFPWHSRPSLAPPAHPAACGCGTPLATAH